MLSIEQFLIRMEKLRSSLDALRKQSLECFKFSDFVHPEALDEAYRSWLQLRDGLGVEERMFFPRTMVPIQHSQYHLFVDLSSPRLPVLAMYFMNEVPQRWVWIPLHPSMLSLPQYLSMRPDPKMLRRYYGKQMREAYSEHLAYQRFIVLEDLQRFQRVKPIYYRIRSASYYRMHYGPKHITIENMHPCWLQCIPYQTPIEVVHYKPWIPADWLDAFLKRMRTMKQFLYVLNRLKLHPDEKLQLQWIEEGIPITFEYSQKKTTIEIPDFEMYFKYISRIKMRMPLPRLCGPIL